jgi:hypothetical protein
VLRLFLEGQVLDLFLANEPQDFALWKKGAYRVPSLRGKHGLLSVLESKGVLTSSVRSRIDQMYEGLNAYVHGAERTLIHSGLFSQRHAGHGFQYPKLEVWSNQVSEVVQIGILILKEKTRIWLNSLRGSSTCTVCREDTLDKIDTFTFAAKEFVRFRCRECKNDETFSKDSGQRVWSVSFNQTSR